MSGSMNRRRIVAVAKDDPPFVFPCAFNSSCHSDPGINIELFKAVIELLGFDYIIIPAEENVTGYIDDKGKWRGMVRQLMDNEANMTATTINIDINRLQVIDYSFPLTYYAYGFLVRRRDAAEAAAVPSFLATPFQPEVWLAFLSWMLISVLLFFAYGCINQRGNSSRSQLLSDSLLMVIRAPVSQVENSRGDESTTKRMIMVLFQIPMLFLMNFYVAGLTSTLTVRQEPSPPFNSSNQLAEMVHNGVYTLVDQGESSKWPADGDNPMAIMRRSFAWNPPIVADNLSHTVQMVAGNSSLVHVASYYSVLFASGMSCQTQVIADEAAQQWLAFAFRKGDPLRRLVSQALYRDASINDFSERLYQKYFNARRCDNDDTTGIDQSESFLPLSLSQVQGVCFMVLLGCTLAVVSVCLELGFFRCRSRLT